MKFSQITYVRPDLENIGTKFNTLLEELKEATDAGIQISVIDEIYKLRAHFETMSNVASIRHTIDTSDVFLKQNRNTWQLLP